MPVTEMGKSENGVVTLGYLLAYNNSNHDQIMSKLNTWINWNDSAKSKIEAAVAKLPDSDKKSCIVSMWNASASSATINVRGVGVSEREYTVQCGGNNLVTDKGGSYSINDFNEYILTVNPDVTFVMQQEVYLLRDKVSAQTTYDQLMSQLTKNYHGKVGMFSQFFGTGPGYVLSLMYYAEALIPELKGTFDLTKEYKFFMGELVGNKELAELTAFVPFN
jgi:ABC-type Fe3+-hydroxamate transport system substrate-binding protein